MNSRKDILDLLDYLRNANETNALITPEHKKTNSYRNNLKTICESKSSEEAYKIIGSHKNVTIDDGTEYIPFEDIYFREDCYDYLITNGLDNYEAEKLTYIIRTGRYGFKKNQILKDKLTPDFFNWAVKVKYLATRIHFIEVFHMECEEYKSVKKGRIHNLMCNALTAFPFSHNISPLLKLSLNCQRLIFPDANSIAQLADITVRHYRNRRFLLFSCEVSHSVLLYFVIRNLCCFSTLFVLCYINNMKDRVIT